MDVTRDPRAYAREIGERPALAGEVAGLLGPDHRTEGGAAESSLALSIGLALGSARQQLGELRVVGSGNG